MLTVDGVAFKHVGLIFRDLGEFVIVFPPRIFNWGSASARAGGFAKTVDGTTAHNVCDGDQVIAECDGSDNLLRKYIYGPGVDEPICMIDCTGQSDVWYFYHLDGLSSN